MARLYPLHLAMLLACALLVWTIANDPKATELVAGYNDLRHFMLNLVPLNQSGLQEGWSFNTPAWSISTEFIINVAFLAFIAMGTRVRVAACVLFGVAILGLAATIRPILSDSYVLGFIDQNLARCAAGFGAGVAIHLAIEHIGAIRALARHPLAATTLGGASLLGMVLLMIATTRHPAPSVYLASIVAASGAVLFVPASTGLRWLLSRKPLVYLGDISYSIYLTHYPIQLALYLVARATGLSFDASPVLAAYLLLVIGISSITYRYLELPAQQRLLALTTRNRVAAPSTTT